MQCRWHAVDLQTHTAGTSQSDNISDEQSLKNNRDVWSTSLSAAMKFRCELENDSTRFLSGEGWYTLFRHFHPCNDFTWLFSSFSQPARETSTIEPKPICHREMWKKENCILATHRGVLRSLSIEEIIHWRESNRVCSWISIQFHLN